MKSKIWKIPYSRPVIPPELLAAGYTPLLAAVLDLRGITTVDAAARLIRGSESCLHDPMLMKGMPAAVERVHRAISSGETVAVYGDYDVDGITSTCVVTDYLRGKGLKCIPYIPDRNGEGYGVNNGALDTLHAQGVTLVITVDCGITAAAETEYAASLGMDMLITDHHECPSGALPAASAVVDCKQDGDEYPNKELAGVGVALKLVCACEGDSAAMLARYVDLVAIGTVADVMPLVDENRYLVRRGLARLASSPRPGIAAMLRDASVDAKKLTATTIGFSIAPRLNAAGRLGQAMTAAKLLMTQDTDAANALAAELCELNRRRQSIETGIWEEANAILAGKTPDAPIVLASDHWHQGVIGIAAFHAQEIPFCVADAVTQRAEPVGIRVIKGDGADSGDALPQIDPKPRPGVALPGGNGHGAAAVPPADDQLGVAVAALKRPADILGAINGGRVDLDDLVTDLQSGGSGLGAQNVVKGSNRDRIVAELQTHDLPHGDQQFCCPGVYRKQRHRDSKNRQKFPDSFHLFSPPHVRACLVNMTRAEKHNRCKCRKIRNRMGTLAFFVLILILYLGTSE